MKSPTPSSAAISTIFGRSWAISCSRWFSMRAWRRKPASSPSTTWSRRFATSSSAGIRMCFGEAAASSPGAVSAQWSEIKAREKAARAERRARAGLTEKPPSLLDGVPLALPALTRAVKLQEKAGEVGFDWANARLVLDKIREETEEVAAELPADNTGAPCPALTEEIGDLLFVVANLARHAGADPEQALARRQRQIRAAFSASSRRGWRTPARPRRSPRSTRWRRFGSRRRRAKRNETPIDWFRVMPALAGKTTIFQVDIAKPIRCAARVRSASHVASAEPLRCANSR